MTSKSKGWWDSYGSEYGVSKGLSEYDFFLFHHLNLRWNLFRESDGAGLLFFKKIRVENQNRVALFERK